MAGPYGWVPPNYWYTETDTNQVGTAFGFATEISPGAAPLTLDSMVKTVPATALWDEKARLAGANPGGHSRSLGLKTKRFLITPPGILRARCRVCIRAE